MTFGYLNTSEKIITNYQPYLYNQLSNQRSTAALKKKKWTFAYKLNSLKEQIAKLKVQTKINLFHPMEYNNSNDLLDKNNNQDKISIMREIVSVQVGQCGNQVGARFWEFICAEHAIDPEGEYYGQSDLQLEMISAYFDQNAQGTFSPRTVLTDLDRTSLQAIRKGRFGNFFKAENFVEGPCGAGSNWARGYYTEGAQIIGSVQDAIRREAEGCDSFQGFQITHGLGGGTGSGMGCLLIQKLREQYPSKHIETISVFTSQVDCYVEPYNNTLCVPHLLQHVDNCMAFDNQALFSIARQSLKLTTPNFHDVNRLISSAMSAATTHLRFPNQNYSSLSKFAFELVPISGLHFLMFGLAPIMPRVSKQEMHLEASKLFHQIFDPSNTLCDADPREGRYFAASAILRGQLSTLQADEGIKSIQSDDSLSFVQWMPKKINYSVCNTQLGGSKTAAVSIANSTSIQRMFKRISERFAPVFLRKAFTKMYIGQGMDEGQFVSAKQSIDDLRSEYQSFSGQK